MHSITAVNVNTAFSSGLHWLRTAGTLEDSRNGPVLVSPTPVTTTYKKPYQRVLFCGVRDANPFFHLMEAIWMMAGREDVEFVSYFSSNMRNYSDDGMALNGAYGYRWRRMFGFDQIIETIGLLRREPNTRRAVIGMYSPEYDTMENPGSKDIPCNTQIYFDCRFDRLNMTVCCRSNDAVWGAYGANAVHMSVLQEIVAAGVGLPMGDYRQMSNNFHLYTETHDIEKLAWANRDDAYRTLGLVHYPLVSTGQTAEEWLADAEAFCDNPRSTVREYHNRFFYDVAYPMYQSWKERKENMGNGLQWAEQILADDWRIACVEWILRRATK